MPEEKIYYPETIEDTPFPGTESEGGSSSQRSGEGVTLPQATRDSSFPDKRVAVEVIGAALNTTSRKILAEFEFTESGALQIGKYDNGVSGDLRISPNGITARNSSGITTFAIDAETGDAVFKGEIQSGSVVTGEVVIGNNRLIMSVDENGQPSILMNDGTHDRLIIGYDPNE